MANDSLILRSHYLQWVLVQIFPKLRTWPVREWPELLSRVREQEFDYLERIGIIAAVALASGFSMMACAPWLDACSCQMLRALLSKARNSNRPKPSASRVPMESLCIRRRVGRKSAPDGAGALQGLALKTHSRKGGSPPLHFPGTA